MLVNRLHWLIILILVDFSDLLLFPYRQNHIGFMAAGIHIGAERVTALGLVAPGLRVKCIKTPFLFIWLFSFTHDGMKFLPAALDMNEICQKQEF